MIASMKPGGRTALAISPITIPGNVITFGSS
jgi:hypothetical protein